MTTAPTTTSRPRRRWLQFSLRGLMVFVLLISVPLGWLAYRMQRAREQRAAVKAIWDMAGEVRYKSALGNIPETAVSRLGKLCGEEDLFYEVSGVRLNDEWISDASLAHLNGFTRLEQLQLRHAAVTDAGLVHIKELAQLRQLDLSGTLVTDAGLEVLRGLKHLVELRLRNAEVTDAGVRYLRELKQLNYVSLDNTQVTDAGVAELQKALPNCKITR